MPNIKRVGVTFPPDLLKDFDDTIEALGYQNRSKAVQDAVRLFVAEKKLLLNETGDRAGLLMMLYNHQVAGLETVLTDTQHCFSSVVRSTLHIHLTETDCLEAIAVRGKASEVKKLRDLLAAKKGVKLLKEMVLSI